MRYVTLKDFDYSIPVVLPYVKESIVERLW